MKNQNSVSCLENFGTTNQKLLRLYIFTLITLLTHSCDGQAINTAMFEIPSKDQKSYMLRDCRKMTGDDIDCKCAYLGRECQQADVENCRNCSCLDGLTRIFYVKKRYGAVCLSRNNLYNASGFGEKFLIHNPIYKRCARANKTISHTNCTFNDPRQVWLWTPGNLLMNAHTSTCLQTKKTQSNYLPMTVTQCDSSDLGQKWRCDESRLLWGISFDLPNITHAVRYYKEDKNLKARSLKLEVTPGNTWTIFPTNNRSVCSASHNEDKFIDGFIPERSSADKTRLYLAITLPLIVVLLLVIVFILWFLRRRKQRIKESTSKHNLHSNVEHQCSNGSVNSDLNLNSNDVECKSEDNPVYEHCTTTAHPTVTIARNKLYECSNNVLARADSDIYEKPLESVKVRQNKFYASVDPSKNSPRLKPHPTPRSSPKPSPKLAPKPAPTPQPAKKPPTPPRYRVPKVMHPPEEDEQDVYDQPLGFIPSLQKKQDDKKKRDEIPLEDLENQRVHSTYEKPLPHSPPRSGIYDYATREEWTLEPTQCQAEKPLEFTKGKEHSGSVNSNGSLYDAPHYDVLERN